MKIELVTVEVFAYTSRQVRDSEGHGHPGPEHVAHHALLTVHTDDETAGYCFGAPADLRADILDEYVRPALIGNDPYDRERLWQDMVKRQRGSLARFSNRAMSAAESALWDLAGRRLGLPIYKLIGAYRDRIPAYGSTMCGDEIDGGLATPDDYGRFAEQLVERGYKAIKLHTWMPPISFAPDVKMDVRAAAAVREAVGPDIELMVDPYHFYTREEALHLGRELQQLDYYWLEEPMDEQSTSSYAWLTRQLDMAVLGPESLDGKMRTRAEWMVRNASDITRAGILEVGGITPTLKTAHLAESFGMACEVHWGGAGSLHVLGAMWNGRWYERGLLHPLRDYETPEPWLHSLVDPMDADGYVSVPQSPGLGEDINFEYIRENLVETR